MPTTDLPANRFRFTEARVRDLTPPSAGKRERYHDTGQAGLCLRVTASGVKSFTVYKKVAGKPVDVTLGRWPGCTVEAARKAAAKELPVMAAGIDPNAAKQAMRAEATLGELLADFITMHAKPRKRTWAEDESLFRRYLTPWRGRRLSAITRQDVIAWHGKIGRDHGQGCANRAHSLLRKMFNFARQRGFAAENPAQGIERFREHSRDRFLDGEELQRLFTAMAKEPSRTMRDLFLAALLTGARRANVCGMRWDDFDLARGLWRIPGEASKNGDPLVVILVPQVVALLRERRGLVANCVPWVFPSEASKAGHVTALHSAWKRLLERAGLTNVRIHDLRRTLASWQVAGGASLPVIGRSLGHRSVTATAIYARLSLDPVRASVERATTAMLAVRDVSAAPSTSHETHETNASDLSQPAGG